MRFCVVLAVGLLAGLPARAQESAESAPPPAGEPSASPPSGEVSADIRRAETPEKKEHPVLKPDDQLLQTAKELYLALLRSDAKAVASLCRAPFLFEGRTANALDEVRRRWSRMLRAQSLSGARLLGVELLTAEEMIRKHGKRPEKLAAWPLKTGVLSIGNLEGHPVVVLWRKGSQGWQAVAAHD